MKVNPVVLGSAVVLVVLAGINQYQRSLSGLNWQVAEQKKQIDRLRQELGDFSRLKYLAAAYGEDARFKVDRRLLPLDHFVLPLEGRPVWIQADDALIQVLREGDSLRVDAWHVVADTNAVYFDKELLPPRPEVRLTP